MRFLRDYQGIHTPGHRHAAGQVADIELPASQQLEALGVVELVEPEQQAAPEKRKAGRPKKAASELVEL